MPCCLVSRRRSPSASRHSSPSISFLTIGGHLGGGTDRAPLALADFIERLALQLTSWEVTSFLIGEYSEREARHPVCSRSPTAFSGSPEDVDRNSAVRKLRATKVRGRAPIPGLHTFRIGSAGIEVFPRIPEQQHDRIARSRKRLSTGVTGLDEMMCGGIPEGDAVILTGPAGSGKTTFASQFVAQGLREGDNCVIAVFEEYPEAFLARAKSDQVDFGEMMAANRLTVLYLRPMTLSVDEMLVELAKTVERVNAKRVVIDSLSGFEIALAPTFRLDFRESVYRLVGALTAAGVTVMMTAEVIDAFSEMRFTNERVSFVTDDILAQRYIEIDDHLEKVMAVVKMRGSDHATDFRRYRLTPSGPVMGEPLRGYHGITTGVPSRDVGPLDDAAGDA